MSTGKDLIRSLEDALLSSPLFRSLTISVDNIEPGNVTLTMDYQEKFTHLGPFIHGGILTTLADAAISAALIPLCPVGSRISAIETSTSFFKSIRNGQVRVHAEIVKKGKKICHLKAAIFDQKEEQLAEAKGSYLIEPPQTM